MLDGYRGPGGSQILVSLPSRHHEMRTKTSGKTGSNRRNSNVDGRKGALRPKVGGEWDPTSPVVWEPDTPLGSTTLPLQSLLSEGAGAGLRPPPNTSAAQKGRRAAPADG